MASPQLLLALHSVHVVLVAYMFPHARPRPGIEIHLLFTPVFAFACPPPLASSITPFTNSQPCRWSHAGPNGLHRYVSPRIPTHIQTHTHTLSLSLSLFLSICGNGITTTHIAPRPASRMFLSWGRHLVYLIFILRTHAQSLPLPFTSNVRSHCMMHFKL